MVSTGRRGTTPFALALSMLLALAAVAVERPAAAQAPAAELSVPAPPTERAWYTPIVPARLLDTRPGGSTVDGLGRPGVPLGANSSMTVAVSGRGGVPASGVSAVVLNVTVTGPSARSYITVWPDGQPRPTASNLNFVAGQTVPNLVVAKIGAGGRVALFNESGSVHVIVDVAGYVPISDSYVPLVPARLLDTRPNAPTVDGQGRPGVRVGPGGVVDVEVLGRGGVPSTGVDAVALNVTATSVTATSFLTVFPTGSLLPNASNLNMVAGQTVPNAVVAKVGLNGRVSIRNAAGFTDVIVDVGGYFESGGTFVALPPARVFETRVGAPVVPGGTNRGMRIGVDQTIEVKVTGMADVPDAGVSAVVLNVTAVAPDSQSYITVWPTGTPRPNASNLNMRCCGGAVPNLVVAKVGAGGHVSVYNESGNTDLLVDVAGYFLAETGAVRALDLSGPSTCALFEVGSLACWGTTPQDPAIQYGGSTIGLKPHPYDVNTVADAVDVAVGDHHTCVLRPNGEVWCWSSPTVFGLAGVDASQQVWPAVRIALPLPAVEIDATYTHSCAVLTDGTVWCWGRDYAGTTRTTPFAIGNLDQVATLSMSMTHACAVRTNGGVRCWGTLNSAGALGDGSGVDSPISAVAVAAVDDAVAVSTGGIRSCVVRSTGGVSCWGSGYGAVPTTLMGTDVQPVSDVVQVALGDALTCVLRGDGAVSCAPTHNGPVPTDVVPNLGPAVELDVGRWHACVVDVQSTVSCWGLNQYGQLGDGTVIDRPDPIVILQYV
jgi:hypothetical protein